MVGCSFLAPAGSAAGAGGVLVSSLDSSFAAMTMQLPRLLPLETVADEDEGGGALQGDAAAAAASSSAAAAGVCAAGSALNMWLVQCARMIFGEWIVIGAESSGAAAVGAGSSVTTAHVLHPVTDPSWTVLTVLSNSQHNTHHTTHANYKVKSETV